jgi:hypothetical protein
MVYCMSVLAELYPSLRRLNLQRWASMAASGALFRHYVDAAASATAPVSDPPLKQRRTNNAAHNAAGEALFGLARIRLTVLSLARPV